MKLKCCVAIHYYGATVRTILADTYWKLNMHLGRPRILASNDRNQFYGTEQDGHDDLPNRN